MHNNDPNWTTAEMVQYPSGQAALVLELMLMIMMFGNVLDEVRQMRTYKRCAAGAAADHLHSAGAAPLLAAPAAQHLLQ